MESQFDHLRAHYETLAQREFLSEVQRQNYITRLNHAKSIADSIVEFRETPDAAITTAAETFSESALPETRDACSQLSTHYMNSTDSSDPSYSPLNVKTNIVHAMIYIHWEHSHLALETPHHVPTKLSIVQEITRKIVNCLFEWSTSIKTSKDSFIQMQRDLRDNKPLLEIMNNFHQEDLMCYGF